VSPLQLGGTGATFVISVLIGIALGIGLEHLTAQSAWVLAGLLAGVGTGAYLAFRQLARYMR
jgi:hypothetical protein